MKPADTTDPGATDLTSQAAEAVAGTVAIGPDLGFALGSVVVVILASWAIGRLARMPGLRGARRWLLLGRVLLWVLVVFDLVFAVGRTVTEHWLLLGALIIGLLTAAGIGWIRNVTAGLALAFEGHFAEGDLVRYRDIEGELIQFGARAVTLRADDGTLHQIPNQRFDDESVTHLEATGQAACEIVVSLLHGVSPERAVRLAKQAAFLTPLASPRHRPDVFLDVGDDDGQAVQMHIRGYAFDPAYRAHFRSDVVARVHDMLRTEKAVEKAG